MGDVNYTLQAGTLTISGSLDWPLGVGFDIQTRSLLDLGKRENLNDLVIDLRGVKFMGSQYLGALAAVAAEAKEMGKFLSVRATGQIAQLLRQTGLDRVLTLEIT